MNNILICVSWTWHWKGNYRRFDCITLSCKWIGILVWLSFIYTCNSFRGPIGPGNLLSGSLSLIAFFVKWKYHGGMIPTLKNLGRRSTVEKELGMFHRMPKTKKKLNIKQVIVSPCTTEYWQFNETSVCYWGEFKGN